MKKMKQVLFSLLLLPVIGHSQFHSRLSEQEWVDSVFNSLTRDQRIAQLMVIRAHSNLGPDHVAKVTEDVRKYNVGALCFFQGGPYRQAQLTNTYQSLAQTPIMVTIDGEWGLGMRLDSVTRFPYQLTLGALGNEELIYKMGIAVGQQCKRLGVHVNYAPVVDVNNNPKNPVIGFRSFGEDKYKVADYGAAYTRGMQDAGIMACAKHFPGHGDVDVDSHYDLPVVNKTVAQLDSLELFPFYAQVKANVGSFMIAHLAIPNVDNRANRATSISKNAVTGLLREKLNYDGLTFTDALEMKGVAKYFPGGTISVEALVAGNDMLCLPASVPESIEEIKKAIKKKQLSWKDIDEKVKKVLRAKYQLGLANMQPVEMENLLDDLNVHTNEIRYDVASRSLTLLRQDSPAIPLIPGKKTAYIGVGVNGLNDFGKRIFEEWDADTYFLSYKDSEAGAQAILKAMEEKKYDQVVIGVHDFSNRPANNYGISATAKNLVQAAQKYKPVTLVFGNVMAVAQFCDAVNLVACYQDDDITQHTAADLLEGKIFSMGRLPVSVCEFKYGTGLVYGGVKPVPPSLSDRMYGIDSIALNGIANKAFPGCVVVAAKDGEIIYSKAFGTLEYDKPEPLTLDHVFDLASVTKISATTLSIMKLYEEGKVKLDGKLGDYLPAMRGTNKAGLRIDDILLHQAGLVPFISFYKETIDEKTGVPNPSIYSNKPKKGYRVRVAENLYRRDDWSDTLMKRIIQSPVGARDKYVYSDNDFILLGKIVEQLSGMTLEEYTSRNFYQPMGLASMGFTPRKRTKTDFIVPTEEEKHFRQQLIRGDVHDEGASLFGGVAGHAGLFSNAYDLVTLYQMLLNGGEINGERYFRPETIELFTSYQSNISRRGLGFDKPEKDNTTRKDPYPALKVSPKTFGHTGFTGTCVWADPDSKLVYVFLSNRVYPTRNNPKLSQMNIRTNIQDIIYTAIGK